MKNKYILAVFIVGVIVTIFGALFKITHFEIGIVTANLLLAAGMITEIIAAVLFLAKMLFSKKADGFLNK